MTEQERMKQGYIWEDDEENLALQAKCKALVKKFNEMPTEAMAEREALLHDIFGEVGENVWLNSPLSATIGKYVTIGSGTYANMNLTLIDDWKITIGKNVLIGPNVMLCTTGHPIHPAHRMDGMYSFPITIGDNVWIGGNVMVLPSTEKLLTATQNIILAIEDLMSSLRENKENLPRLLLRKWSKSKQFKFD